MTIREINAWIAGIFLLFLLAILGLTAQAAGQDAGAGKEVFAKRCSGCHAPDSGKEGPPLRGVVGRKAGTVQGFLYSDALRNSGIVWNESLLDKWLENPQAVVKDNDMEFHVANAGEREAVIAYLKSLAS
jgi:cytochrome c